MTAEHLALVFAAEGIAPSQNHLLLAYADLSDAYGYCANASVERLMAMTGMSERTITRTNKELEAANLLRRQRRTRSDGQTDTSVYRINIAKLAAMRPARPRRFDDNTMAGLGFADEHPPSPEVQISETAPELPIRHFGGWSELPIRQNDTHPVDNSVPEPSTRQNGGWSDLPIRQNDTPRKEEVFNPPPTPSRVDSVSAEAIEERGARFVEELPPAVLARLNGLHRSRLARLIGPALAAGHDPGALAQFLATELGGAQSVYAVIKRRLEVDLPRTPLAPLTAQTARSERPDCRAHPGAGWRPDGECAGCYVDRIATD
ncbi:helix-turn-helix domain-containing protein [Nocardia paucivorans]|uniref:helix-turn-helix domain-containing protein n=1 Tax=Nocardia paucivorans TaxID=114259 RepID=UPI0012FAD421|nr:helix-turn-helix domain-containing protein [Nocardia paucivorans]